MSRLRTEALSASHQQKFQVWASKKGVGKQNIIYNITMTYNYANYTTIWAIQNKMHINVYTIIASSFTAPWNVFWISRGESKQWSSFCTIPAWGNVRMKSLALAALAAASTSSMVASWKMSKLTKCHVVMLRISPCLCIKHSWTWYLPPGWN